MVQGNTTFSYCSCDSLRVNIPHFIRHLEKFLPTCSTMHLISLSLVHSSTGTERWVSVNTVAESVLFVQADSVHPVCAFWPIIQNTWTWERTTPSAQVWVCLVSTGWIDLVWNDLQQRTELSHEVKIVFFYKKSK